jgi:hypothetical protein
MYVYTFLLRMTDTMTTQIIDCSFRDTLHIQAIYRFQYARRRYFSVRICVSTTQDPWALAVTLYTNKHIQFIYVALM